MAKKQPVKPITGKTKPVETPVHKSLHTPEESSFNLHIPNKVIIPILLLLFIALALIYCQPVLSGMQLATHDTNQYIAMNKEIADYKTATGHSPMWTTRMFGGMPGFLIGGVEYSPILNFLPVALVHKVFRLIPDPAMDIVFLLFCAFCGFFALTRRWIYALLGAIAIGFCSANFVSLDAGHITKVITIAMFIPLFSGAYLIFRKNYIWGGILFAFFAYEIIAGAHIQIAYYSFILLGLYLLFEVVHFIKHTDIKHIGISGGILLSGLVIAVLMNYQNFMVNDFSKDTTRGADILNAAKMNPTEATKSAKVDDKKEKGVGFDYATQWSLGFEELVTTIIPNFSGGSSGGSLDENSEVYKVVSSKAPQYAQQFIQRLPLYWGSEPFVQGPIYLGAIIFFLFVFGMFAYKGNLKWWAFGGIVLTVLIALGKNFAPFYHLLYNVVPMFNKFRAPTMILALTQILMVLVGVLGLMEFFNKHDTKEERMKTLKYSTGIVGGILIFLIVFGGIFSFRSKNMEGGKSADDQFKAQLVQMSGDEGFANQVVNALVADRVSIMRKDAIRSLIFVLLVAGLLFVFAKTTFHNKYIYISAISLLVLIDYWGINKRYLNDGDFEDSALVENNAFPLTPADQAILSENKNGARMVDLSGDVFNSASPAYYHRTIGGYNPAKLRRYQDVIEYGISHDFGLLNKGGFANANFINMLNTKYLKQGNEANQIIVNPYALGNAWFVNNIQKVETPEDEILKVRDINPARTAIVNKEFDNILANAEPNTDTSAQNDTRFIRLIDSKNPMKMEYSFKSPNNEFVVFSEVIYRPNEDWVSYIDGKEAKHVRVNYILRGMEIKSGEHKITFEFKPKMLAKTNTMLLIGNLLFYVFIGGMLFWWWRNKKSVHSATEKEK